MIEAKDLRIGDIVRMTDDNGNMVPCKVVGVDEERCRNSVLRGFLNGAAHLRPFDLENDEPSDSRWCKDIEPILLTPEILERNGWKENATRADFLHCDKAFVKIDSPTVCYRGGMCFCDVGSFTVELDFVHRLQHLLWALGENAEMEV